MSIDWKTQQMIKASGWPLAPELLAPGASFNARLAKGLVPLHWACALGKPGVVAHMLANGANIQDRTDSGQDMLDLAVTSGNFQTVMLVIEQLKATRSAAPSVEQRAQLAHAFGTAHTNAKNRLQQALRDWDKRLKKPG